MLENTLNFEHLQLGGWISRFYTFFCSEQTVKLRFASIFDSPKRTCFKKKQVWRLSTYWESLKISSSCYSHLRWQAHYYCSREKIYSREERFQRPQHNSSKSHVNIYSFRHTAVNLLCARQVPCSTNLSLSHTWEQFFFLSNRSASTIIIVRLVWLTIKVSSVKGHFSYYIRYIH